MKKTITLAIATAAALTPIALAAPAASANPGSPGCVTRAEFNGVHKGWTKPSVDHKFGTHGHRDAGATSGGYRSEIWSYKTCTRYSAVSIAYSANPHRALRFTAKSAVWSY